MKYHKKRQFTFKAYQDPYHYQPAKHIQWGIIKILKYPQELESQDPRDWNKSHYKGFLFTHKFYRPKILFKGKFFIGLEFNLKPVVSPRAKKRLARQEELSAIRAKDALKQITDEEKKLRKDLNLTTEC